MLPRAWLVLPLLLALADSAHPQADLSTQDPPAEPPACLAKRADSPFSDFDAQRALWEAQYALRKAEFRPKMLVHADELGRCVERALRRGLGASSRTTFGVRIAADGRVAQVAVLESNHADNLYGNCLARALCKIELAAPSAAEGEVFSFNFDVRRRAGPHQRPWSLDPAR